MGRRFVDWLRVCHGRLVRPCHASATPVPNARPDKPAVAQLSIARRLFHWARNGFAIVGFLFVFYCCFFELSVIVSESMSPTLRGSSVDDGDWVLTEKVSLWLREPMRWEVISCRQKDGRQCIWDFQPEVIRVDPGAQGDIEGHFGIDPGIGIAGLIDEAQPVIRTPRIHLQLPVDQR